jgi:integrase
MNNVTLKAVVRSQQEKEGGIFNIKIRVTHQRKKSFFSTKVFVSKRQLAKDLSFKDPKVIKDNADMIFKFYQMINLLGDRINSMDVKEIANYLETFDQQTAGKTKKIDFIAEGYEHALTQKKRYQDSFKTTLRSFSDFVEQDSFDIQQLTSSVLFKYQDYLKKPRTGKRKDRYGNFKDVKLKGVSESTVNHYITDIRTIFSALKTRYNGEHIDDMPIRHNPFAIYKIKGAPETKKRNLKPILIKLIRDFKERTYMGTHGTNRATLAKDVFMLSFYLAGINTVDLFEVTSYKDGRLNYNRTKTMSKRKDKSFMSIMVPNEAKPILDRYLAHTGEKVFIFHKMYADAQAFNKNVNKGLKKMVSLLKNDEIEKASKDKLVDEDLDITTYYARHSWATIARNICKISKDDISEALNHASEHDVTDIYIEKDWEPIDTHNRKVLDVLLDNSESLKESYEIPDIKDF